MESSIGLFAQDLANDAQRVLFLSHLVGLRTADGWFRSQEVTRLVESLRLPPLANVSATLGRLRGRRLIVQNPKAGVWSLTPRGRAEAAALLAALDANQLIAQLQAETNEPFGAEFGGATHPVIPPELAPPRWSAGIARLLGDYPFERNVFCMTRFPEDGGVPDVVTDVIDTARTTLREHGLHLHVASDGLLDDELFGNVGAYMWACRYGIGLLEDRAGRGLNYNVMTELGSMLITGRRCALLKDKTVPSLPTDLAGHVYKPLDFDDSDAVSQELEHWISNDLGL